MSDGSRQTLTNALDRGRALLQTIRARCEVMFTVTGRPREYYRKSLEAIEALERDVTKAQTALQAYDEKINQWSGCEAVCERMTTNAFCSARRTSSGRPRPPISV